jgi:FAD/FMN-containing dehydrogenase
MTINRRTFLGTAVGAVATAGLRSGYLAGASRPGPRGGIPWSQLQSHLQGRLVLPGDTAYATAVQLDLGQFDSVNPQGVAYCVSSTDVATSLKFAQDNRLPFAVRSGGHNGGGFSTSTGVVIDVSGLDGVTVGASTVTVGAGNQGVDVINALAPQGLAIPGGYCPTVGVGGYYQGGGIGLVSRFAGLGSDRVASAQVVLADGRTVTASPTSHPDLYWALRGGGGGNFGVVTSFDVTPIALTDISLIQLEYSWDAAPQALDGYAQWLVDAPRTVASASLVELFDATAGNTPVTAVYLLSTGTLDELNSEAARLVALTGTPQVQTPAATMPYQTAMMSLYGCSTYTVAQCHRTDNSASGLLPRQEFGLLRSRLFAGPPPLSMWEQLAALYDTQRVAGQAHALEIWPLNGAVHDVQPGDTAFVHRDSLLSLSLLGSITTAANATPAGQAAAKQWVDDGFGIVDPVSSGETYQNFIDAELDDWQSSYYGANYPRLRRVKHAYDPFNAFRFAQSIR